MKILVLNGSPKGDVTITMQYVAYLRKMFPSHNFEIINVSQKIHSIENVANKFDEILEKAEQSDVILWATPIYVFLIPSQLKRFIELIYERNAQSVFCGKHTAVLTSSIHFYDHTAHNYLHAVSDDLEMNYIGMFSADMDDLLSESGREKLSIFMKSLEHSFYNNLTMGKAYFPMQKNDASYEPGDCAISVDTQGLKVCILADRLEPGSNLAKMVARFRQTCRVRPEIFELAELDIRGGCLGCCRCGYDGDCAYCGKDGFIDFFKNRLQVADVLVFAGEIHDRFLSWRWKQFFDRSFFRNHTPSFGGHQIGWIISGPLAQLPNLRQVLDAYAQWQKANLVDFVTDEPPESTQIDVSIDSFAQRLVHSAHTHYVQPSTFLGVAGAKLFRDEVWGRFRFPFKADYDAFKAAQGFDFPQKNYSSRLKNTLLLLLSKNPFLRRQIYVVGMKEKMTARHRKVVRMAVAPMPGDQ